ncbi:kinesin-like protein KIF2A isoform X2 [Varroa destructor]|uniref:Kinesin-like protein n=1 Tax=Varroa destructor TaxID=109461 RepID=A0A7M7K517_VARDE|nr:kinesin-like protein KIF2A isoform X2 [Varroa destructor]
MLTVGVDVSIQRTSGKVHSAKVTEINERNRTVTVEWFENGDTKGKEVSLMDIVALNPQYFVGAPSPNLSATGPRLERIAIAPVGAIVQPQHYGRTTQINGSTTRVAVVDNDFVAPAPPQHKKQIAKPAVKLRASMTAVTADNNNSNYAVINKTSKVEKENSKEQQQTATQQQTTTPVTPVTPVTPQESEAPRSGATDNGQDKNPVVRKSVAMSKVDEIKKNREERRAKQAEAMAHKQEMTKNSSNNKNWEFGNMIKEYRQQLNISGLNINEPVLDHKICVAVRKRPLNKRESARGEVDVVTIPNRDTILVHEPKTKLDLTRYLDHSNFRFDYAFDEGVDNELVYRFTAKPLVKTVFDGGMATCFAYGQTGSGKTHTMGGNFSGKGQDCSKGIYYMATRDIFTILRQPKYASQNLVVTASYFEIYAGKVFDLLNGKDMLRVLEDAKGQVQVCGLTEIPVHSVDEVLELIQKGSSDRTSGQTQVNANSSRSHAVFQISLRKATRLHGKFSLIDLAGNERGADTASADQRTRMEGAEINKSLLALKECIRALGRKNASHTPFRSSKLTHILKDSFIGENTRTCMIAMISPGMASCENSLNTLRYADRVKELGAENPLERQEREDRELENIVDVDDDDALYDGDQISSEMLELTQAVSHLQELEEDLLEAHREMIEVYPKFTVQLRQIMDVTKRVDYDMVEYVGRMTDLIEENKQYIERMEARCRAMRQQMQEEEKISMALKRPTHY